MSSARQTIRAARRATARSAFTLIEMLVVIALIVIVIAVTVPAVARIIESANYSAAINTVTAAMGNARATAMQRQKVTGVAFLFDIETKQYSLIQLELLTSSASLVPPWRTPDPASPEAANAIAFRPALNSTPVLLPKGTGVYGFSLSIDPLNARTDVGPGGFTHGWYEGERIEEDVLLERVIPWIFPRNDPRLFLDEGEDAWHPRLSTGELDTTLIDSAVEKQRARRHADSFCVVFNPDGTVATRLELGAKSGFGGEVRNAYLEFPDLASRVQPGSGVRIVFDEPAAFDPDIPNAPDGSTRNPEVKLRAVAQLAVVDMNRLAGETGVAAPWLLRAGESPAPWREYLDSGGEVVEGPGLDELVRRLSEWIDDNAEVIAFDRYTGSALRR